MTSFINTSKTEIKIFLCFIFIGGISTLLDYSSYIMLLKLTEQIVLSKIISMLIAMTFSFISNKNLTFKEVRSRMIGEKIRFSICQAINLSVNVTCNYLFYKSTNSINTSFIAATFVAMSINFLIQRFWVFGGKK